MILKFEQSRNHHLKVLTEDFITLTKRVVDSFPPEKVIKVLNIGGGYQKEIERYFLNHHKIDYYCLDVDTTRLKHKNVIVGDITDQYLNIDHKFDFIFTKDTFEHILNPWDSTENIKNLLCEGGYFLCIAPFSWRYHACPVDSYRYTHTGLRYIFERLGGIQPIFAGYKKIRCATSGHYASRTDYTLDGRAFLENIETIYLAIKNSSHSFNLGQIDFDKEEH